MSIRSLARLVASSIAAAEASDEAGEARLARVVEGVRASRPDLDEGLVRDLVRAVLHRARFLVRLTPNPLDDLLLFAAAGLLGSRGERCPVCGGRERSLSSSHSRRS